MSPTEGPTAWGDPAPARCRTVLDLHSGAPAGPVPVRCQRQLWHRGEHTGQVGIHQIRWRTETDTDRPGRRRPAAVRATLTDTPDPDPGAALPD